MDGERRMREDSQEMRYLGWGWGSWWKPQFPFGVLKPPRYRFTVETMVVDINTGRRQVWVPCRCHG